MTLELLIIFKVSVLFFKIVIIHTLHIDMSSYMLKEITIINNYVYYSSFSNYKKFETLAETTN